MTDPVHAYAVFLDRTTIVLPPSFGAGATGFALVDGDTVVPLTARPGGLFQGQSRRSPHLRGHRAFSVRELGDQALGELLRGRPQVIARETGERTGVQLAGVLDDLYAEAADAELGPVIDEGRPRLSVWAPTARTVDVQFSGGQRHEMTRDPVSGVWSITGEPAWIGRYYRYRVEVWHPAVQRIVTTEVTDPYSVALAADSTHSLLADLTDPALAPPGWDRLVKPPPVRPARMQIAEVSIRDFSIGDTSLPENERGTYAAFTRPGATSMRHLRSLAEAGLTHLHLMPAFDFAGVPDRRADQAEPAGDLAAFPPGSPEQQRAVAAVADRDGYNWGYNPWHYTVPEGSYALDPDGAARVREFRAMVAALNAAGLRVVLDVVYNHTAADGVDRYSVLDRIVPGYYHRRLEDGSTAQSTCCANTATEHMMMAKLVIDSVVRWATAYKIDGFRFDLMGHHPRGNILETRIALDHLPDGHDIVLYGEGWDFGEVRGGARFAQATQRNMAGTGIGTFNDRLRDAVRGGGALDADPTTRGFATGLGAGTPRYVHDEIKVGLAGGLAAYRFVTHTGAVRTGAEIDYRGQPSGYTSAPGESINYVDAHDNEILYDALAYKLPPGTGIEDRARHQVLALSLVVLGQGAGFIALGSERLRSKSLDRNSYDSGDWFNQIRWDPATGNGFGAGLPPARENESRWPLAGPLLADPALVPPPELIERTAERYRELLRIRRASPVFGLPTAEEVQRRVAFPLSGPDEPPGVIVMSLDATGADPLWSWLVVVFNATTETTVVPAPVAGLRLHPELATSADPLIRHASADDTKLIVPALSVAVFVAGLAGSEE
nr:pullulanase-type alpha-1,6-glucosidase [uncultured Actinoplanes sp.]